MWKNKKNDYNRRDVQLVCRCFMANGKPKIEDYEKYYKKS